MHISVTSLGYILLFLHGLETLALKFPGAGILTFIDSEAAASSHNKYSEFSQESILTGTIRLGITKVVVRIFGVCKPKRCDFKAFPPVFNVIFSLFPFPFYPANKVAEGRRPHPPRTFFLSSLNLKTCIFKAFSPVF